MAHAFSIQELVEAVGGECLQSGSEAGRYQLSTDTRRLAPDHLYVALKGERFDGHDFLDQVLAIPGAGVMGEVGRLKALDPSAWVGRPMVGVSDPLLALGAAAASLRRGRDIPVVGVTGTAGKTTTREMIRAILESQVGATLGPQKNFNNHVGLPLTLLELSTEHRAAVLEMGMSGLGEIRYLAELAEPSIRLITNVGRAHLDTLGDEDGVARAKGELFETARPGDVLIINLDDRRIAALERPLGAEVVTYGRHPDSRVRLVDDDSSEGAFTVTCGGASVTVTLPLLGRYQRLNATSALAVAHALDLDLKKAAIALIGAHFESMRMERIELPQGATLLNDAYNANPESMEAALSTLTAAGRGGVRHAILGDMLELGPLAEESHRALGARVHALGIERLWVMGAWAQAVVGGALEAGMDSDAMVISEAPDALAQGLAPQLSAGDWILLKGSRGMRMERVAEALQDLGRGEE